MRFSRAPSWALNALGDVFKGDDVFSRGEPDGNEMDDFLRSILTSDGSVLGTFSPGPVLLNNPSRPKITSL